MINKPKTYMTANRVIKRVKYPTKEELKKGIVSTRVMLRA